MNKQFPLVPCLAIVISLITASPATADDAIKRQILQLFPQADTNGDGVLSDAEEAALSQQSLKKYPKADANGDGVLSDAEKQKLLRTAANSASRKPASTTTDKTKKAPAQEVRAGVFRTPDARFENLKDYPFEPHYVEVDSKIGKLRLHYIDVGPRDADPILLMHGEPSWSYLYRKMIPPLVAAGHRVIAPDLIGFGRSDKPANRTDHSYQNHVDWMTQFVTDLDLKNVTLFCQDWGSLIGLRVVTGAPDRFACIVAGNAALPAGPGDDGVVIGGQWNGPDPTAELRFEEGFMPWLKYSQTVPKFDCGLILQKGTVHELSQAELEAYRAPFPDERYNAGPRVMPTLVRSQMASNREAWKVLAAFDKPFLTTFSDRDPVTKGGEKLFQKRVPGAKDQPHTIVKQAGHFLQEDASEELATLINRLIAEPVFAAETPLPVAKDLSSHGVTQADLDGLDAIMLDVIKNGTITGCSFLVAHKGEIVYRKAHGEFTTDQRVPLASVSKPLAASVIMALAEQGKLSLEDPVEKYLPEFKGIRVKGSQAPARPMTIRHVLSHMAGFWGNKKITPKKMGLIRDFSQTLQESVKGAAQYELIHQPGTKWTYSGIGYCVAGRVAEVALGDQSFEKVSQDAMFRPMGMKRYNLCAHIRTPVYPGGWIASINARRYGYVRSDAPERRRLQRKANPFQGVGHRSAAIADT